MTGRELKAAWCNFMAETIRHTGTEPAVFVIQPYRPSKFIGPERSVTEWYLWTTDCPGARTLDIWEMTWNPLFSISIPMQNLCQINYTHLFCGRDNVAMKVFAFNMRIEKLSTTTKKVWKWDYWQRKCKRQLWRTCRTKKRIEYYFREVRFDSSHAAVWTDAQHSKLLTYHHAYY